MPQPEGFYFKGMNDHVYRLKKAPYGLRRASGEWHTHLDKFLKEMGCKCSDAASLLYLPRNGKIRIFIIIRR